MTEQVKRHMATCDCMREAAWGDYVRFSDHSDALAALHQQVEGLRESMAFRGSLVGRLEVERDQLLAELEAARGLLRDMRYAARTNPSCQYGVVNPCRCGYCVDARADTFITATPAPEVRCTTCDGTGDVHRADGEWLGECHCVKTEHAERQDAVAEVVWPPSGIRHGAFKAIDASALGPGTKLYTSPPPAQDVSALVEALGRFVDLGISPGSWPELDAALRTADKALATYRKETKS